MSLHDSLTGEIWRSPALIEDFEAITGCGGRFAGSDSEARALALLRSRLGAIPGVATSEHVFEYDGWERTAQRLTLLGPTGRDFPCHALIWTPDTPPGGIEAELVDLGRGARADFDAHGNGIDGRIVVVRQDYPFGSDTVHRSVKYAWGREAGAVGFLLSSAVPGDMPATGYSATNAPDDIPAAGISIETARALGEAGDDRPARLRLEVRGARKPATGVDLIAEVPGQGPEWVVLSAHYDGHDLAESALDNATGAAAVLQILRTYAPHVGGMRRGLRAMLFTAEEWGLTGSRLYVDGLTEAERRAIAVDVNLDTIAGSPRVACLVSGYAALGDFARAVAREAGLEVPIVEPLKRNSDHYNFARRGIPAMRLVAGFDEPECDVRYILTAADRRDMVADAELKGGTLVAAEMVWHALNWPGTIAPHKSGAEIEEILRGLE